MSLEDCGLSVEFGLSVDVGLSVGVDLSVGAVLSVGVGFSVGVSFSVGGGLFPFGGFGSCGGLGSFGGFGSPASPGLPLPFARPGGILSRPPGSLPGPTILKALKTAYISGGRAEVFPHGFNQFVNAPSAVVLES